MCCCQQGSSHSAQAFTGCLSVSTLMDPPLQLSTSTHNQKQVQVGTCVALTSIQTSFGWRPSDVSSDRTDCIAEPSSDSRLPTDRGPLHACAMQMHHPPATAAAGRTGRLSFEAANSKVRGNYTVCASKMLLTLHTVLPSSRWGLYGSCNATCAHARQLPTANAQRMLQACVLTDVC